jgi:hypothetical protein
LQASALWKRPRARTAVLPEADSPSSRPGGVGRASGDGEATGESTAEGSGEGVCLEASGVGVGDRGCGRVSGESIAVGSGEGAGFAVSGNGVGDRSCGSGVGAGVCSKPNVKFRLTPQPIARRRAPIDRRLESLAMARPLFTIGESGAKSIVCGSTSQPV